MAESDLYRIYVIQIQVMTEKETLDKFFKGKYLYKYLSFEAGLKMLQKSTIRFTHAELLNDPFDCFNGLQDCIPLAKLGICSKDMNDEDETEDNLGEWWSRKALTKYAEALENIPRQFNEYHIFSASSTPKSILMWSYYNNHKGICIGLGKKELIQYLHTCYGASDFVPVTVKYAAKLQKKGNQFDGNSYENIAHVTGTKYYGWKHEQEKRIVLINPDFDDKFDIEIPPTIFRELYLGCNFNKMQIGTVKYKKFVDVLKTKYGHIRIKQCTQCLDCFKIKTVPCKIEE